jgi:hypothetical protein
MVRAFVLYENEPDLERYEPHAELCHKVPGGTFRHGKVFGAPMGEPAYAYYAEWEFPDRDAFKPAARSSWRRARTRWRWAAASTCCSRISRERAPAGCSHAARA